MSLLSKLLSSSKFPDSSYLEIFLMGDYSLTIFQISLRSLNPVSLSLSLRVKVVSVMFVNLLLANVRIKITKWCGCCIFFSPRLGNFFNKKNFPHPSTKWAKASLLLCSFALWLFFQIWICFLFNLYFST